MDSDDQPSASVPTIVLTQGTTLPPSSDARLVIWLDEHEEVLFQTLVAAANAYEQGDLVLPLKPAQPLKQQVQIRVAGGWVRDKLLGLHSHDVDVAIDTLSGVEFATIVQLYLKEHAPDQVKKMGVIAANPLQSKHLETATMVVHGMEVDFCNLRGQEVYEKHSRIPMTGFGTPLNDAERRDFTINALFFNLRTQLVEDWTGRGLSDLKEGIVETPLDPHVTFHDDPLRVLRAIRFAVRFGFSLHDELQKACMSPDVHMSLQVKVSRERVGKELEGMLSGRNANPGPALETIGRLGLSECVFCLPTNLVLEGSIMGHTYNHKSDDGPQLILSGWETAQSLLQHIPSVYNAHINTLESSSSTTDIVSKVDIRLLHLAVFLSPFRHLTHTDHKDKVLTAVTYMMRDGIKFKNKDVDSITTLMETVDEMKGILHTATNNNGPWTVSRLKAGILMRTTKELWVTCLLVATVLQIGLDNGLGTEQHWIQQSQKLFLMLVEMGLDLCWKMKPLMDGRAVMQALNLPKGPYVGKYLDAQVQWMLMYPEGSREDCEEHLRVYKRELESQNGQPSTAEEHVSKKMHIQETR